MAKAYDMQFRGPLSTPFAGFSGQDLEQVIIVCDRAGFRPDGGLERQNRNASVLIMDADVGLPVDQRFDGGVAEAGRQDPVAGRRPAA